MKYITIKLTEDQFNHVLTGLSYTMEDYIEEYGEDWVIKENDRKRKENAFTQRFIDSLVKQYKKQINN